MRSTARGTPHAIADVISFNFSDIHPHDLASILDTEGICIRAGHHCTMPLMDKMGWPATARASFYIYNTRSRRRRADRRARKSRARFQTLDRWTTFTAITSSITIAARAISAGSTRPTPRPRISTRFAATRSGWNLLVDDGVVRDVRFSGKGCAISQASASMLTEEVKGMRVEDVARLSKDVVLENVGIGISPTRMKCAMLGLRVLKSAAIGEIAGWPDEE